MPLPSLSPRAVLLSLFVLTGSGLAGCGEHGESAADVEQLYVDEGPDSVEIEQRFDAHGELIETRIVHRSASDERELHAHGVLLTERGATEGGDLVRAFLASLPPRLLARLSEADVRFDVAVLAADALLELDLTAQRAAAGVLEGEGALCARLGACASEHEPGQT